MPHISPEAQDCSVFLYRSKEAAKAGEHFGGSGFLCHVPIEGFPHLSQMYVITNKHVLDGGFHVLRLNKTSGGFDTIATKRDDWFSHPKEYDVQALPLDIGSEFKWRSVSQDVFVSRELIDAYRIGLGDDAFLVGRLVTHAGRQKNAPIVRFGNISLMADPDEPIDCGDKNQEAFLVECRSLSGFSGSPVFVETEQYYYGEAAQKLIEFRKNRQSEQTSLTSNSSPPEAKAIITIQSCHGRFGPWLLGIDFAHIPLWKPVYELKKAENQYARDKHWVEANTGIACVLPAWEIDALLNREELMDHRREEGKRFDNEHKSSSSAINDVSDSDEPTNEPVFTREDFEDALTRVSRKKSAQI